MAILLRNGGKGASFNLCFRLHFNGGGIALVNFHPFDCFDAIGCWLAIRGGSVHAHHFVEFLIAKIITFEVRERALLLDIKYEGLKSVQQSTLLEEFRKRSVGLSKESQYDPVKAKRAAAVIKELLANEGRPEATVDPVIEEISATAVGLTFKIVEGPQFPVADIEFEETTLFSIFHL